MNDALQVRGILEFAVLGHPNEGNSSVVSTLIYDDRIKVSRIPGETIVSNRYTVRIDGDPEKIVEQFIDTFEKDLFFVDECELLGPLTKGAGITTGAG